MEPYLKRFYHEEITNLLNDANDAVHVSIDVCLTKLQDEQPALFAALLSDAHGQCRRWNAALLSAQAQLLEGNAFLEPDFQIKANCHVRFVSLPASSAPTTATQASAAGGSSYPTNAQAGRFVQVRGSVVRMSQSKVLEYKREYECSKCKRIVLAEADYMRMYAIEAPKGGCPQRAPAGSVGGAGCRGTMFQRSAQPVAEHCIDVQEIRIQEMLNERSVPASMVVTLDNDLVDSCQPGDNVTICGTVELRWRSLQPNKRPEVILTLRAISVRCDKNRQAIVAVADLPEHLLCVRADWQEAVDALGGYEQKMRDLMLRSFCPEIHGMYVVKLAVLLALSSGVNGRIVGQTTATTADITGIRGGRRPAAADDPKHQPMTMQTRGSSHVILVGDPGLAKSKVLRFAAAASARSVNTTGMGCSAAGLTATAVKENGEWQLEAGALVLADGGVCCIDEFNSMRESDKATIHEAMEQQSISMAKSGLVCKLKTRCAVVAATNPKNMAAMQVSDGATPVEIGIASPLLSRFDVVLILRDDRDPEWDDRVASHLLEPFTRVRLGAVEEHTNGQIRGKSDEEHPLWTVQQFQTHLTAIRDICPTVKPQANAVLGAYFRACRADKCRNPARTSVRLLDSLMRLASAHARLMFRDVVTEMDALTVVRLMESSWGFGNLLQPQDVLRAPLPFGPSADDVRELKMRLGLPVTEWVPEADIMAVEERTGADCNGAAEGAALRRSHSGSDMFRDVHDPPPQFNDKENSEFTQTPLLTNRNFQDESSVLSNLNRINRTGNDMISPPIAETDSHTVKLSQAEMDDIMSWVDFEDEPSNVTDDVKMVIDSNRQTTKRDQVAAELTNISANPFKTTKRSKLLSSTSSERPNILKASEVRNERNETTPSALASISSERSNILKKSEVCNEGSKTTPSASAAQQESIMASLLCPLDDGNLDFLDDFDI